MTAKSSDTPKPVDVVDEERSVATKVPIDIHATLQAEADRQDRSIAAQARRIISDWAKAHEERLAADRAEEARTEGKAIRKRTNPHE